MVRTYISKVVFDNNQKVDTEELGKALRNCCDLPALQNSSLTQLPSVVRRARTDRRSLALAKALRIELVACAEQITQRTRHPVREIMAAIEEAESSSTTQSLTEIQAYLGVPFPRDKIDLARYYTIRLVVEGVKNETIAEFLKVDIRTVGNYIVQAKERIMLALGFSCNAEPGVLNYYPQR
jgi:DNA-binding NarL/FixJ family response regulator